MDQIDNRYQFDINTDPSKAIEIVTNRTYGKREVGILLGDLRNCRRGVNVLRSKKGGCQAVMRDYYEKQSGAHHKHYRPFHTNRNIALVDIILR
jgi:hypothetical protein